MALGRYHDSKEKNLLLTLRMIWLWFILVSGKFEISAGLSDLGYRLSGLLLT